MKLLNVKNRSEFRKWLKNNHDKENECFVVVKRSEPLDNKCLYYLDAVEEALCFGWIDSTTCNVNGKFVQRFSPRRKSCHWTELNIARVKRLIKLKKMDKAGLAVFPKVNNKFIIDKEIEKILKKENIYDIFTSFPILYQRIRIYNLLFTKARDKDAYKKALNNFIKQTKQNKMYGNWNDYGRLK